jgi:hypothetical protein
MLLLTLVNIFMNVSQFNKKPIMSSTFNVYIQLLKLGSSAKKDKMFLLKKWNNLSFQKLQILLSRLILCQCQSITRCQCHKTFFSSSLLGLYYKTLQVDYSVINWCVCYWQQRTLAYYKIYQFSVND